MSPWWVRPANPALSRKLLARPKSESLIDGRIGGPVTSRFEGLMSRWTYPLEWAWSSADQQLHADPRAGRGRERPGERPDPLLGVLADDVFHDELELAVELEHRVEGDDVRGCLEVLEDVQLALEPELGPVAGGDRGDHHLDGDRAVGGQLAGEEDLAHPAAADPLLDQVFGVGGRVLAPVRDALVAEPADDVLVGQGADGEVGRRELAAAEAVDLGPAVPGGLLDLDHERALARGDRVAVAEPDGVDPGAVDLRAVGAAQVAEEADRRVELDQEVVPRQEPVLGHRELDLRRPPDHERLVAVEGVFHARMRPGGNPKNHFHPGSG